jgi:hypothetical protein
VGVVAAGREATDAPIVCVGAYGGERRRLH